MHVTGEHELGVPDPRAHLDELRGVLEPVVEMAGIEDRGVPAGEAERKRFVVTEAAGHVDAGRAHDVRALLVGHEVDLEPERGEHPCAQRVVLVGEHGERLFQQVDRGLVPSGAREHVPAVVPDRGAGESFGVAERPGDRPGFDERVRARR